MKNNCNTTTCLFDQAAASGYNLLSEYEWPYAIVDDEVVPYAPPCVQSRQSAVNLRVPPIEVVHVGFVGLGRRANDVVLRWAQMEGVEISALCDLSASRAADVNSLLVEHGYRPAHVYSGADGYKDMCQSERLDLVYVATDWEHHYPIASHAMQCGCHVAIEVPAALNLREIWGLIDLAEQRRLHCFMLENCCYDIFELHTLAMARGGAFGEIEFASGGYCHDLTTRIDGYWRKDAADNLGWRIDYNRRHRGDLYATHGLGPIAQVLGLHRDDDMQHLISLDTTSINGQALASRLQGSPCQHFANADHTVTLITTRRGRLIQLQHNTMTPQPYSRMYELVGTDGYAAKYPVEGYSLSSARMDALGIDVDSAQTDKHAFLNTQQTAQLQQHYPSPILDRYAAEALPLGSHDAKDYIMEHRLIDCLHQGAPLDIDVYDLAEWCCIGELSSLSLQHPGKRVRVPQFVR